MSAPVYPTFDIEILILGPSTWAPISYASDVLPGISLSYGMFNNYPPGAHVADIGTMNVTFDNTSTDFRYTPPAAVRGFSIGEKWRLKLSYEGTDYYKFVGRVKGIEATPGQFEERKVEVELQDFISDMAAEKVDRIAVQYEQLGNACVSTVVNNMGVQPNAVSYSTNGETFLYAFHDLYDEVTSCLNAVAAVTQSELGHFYIAGDVYNGERATYRNRYSWVNDGEHLGTLTDNYTEFGSMQSYDMIADPVRLTYRPVTIDNEGVLFSSYQPYKVGNGNTRRIYCSYTDPNNPDARISSLSSDIITPVSGTDYTISYTEGATDNGAASDITVTLNKGANRARYDFAHAGSDYPICWINFYQIRGKAILIYDYQQVESGTNPLFLSDTDFPTDLEFVLPYEEDSVKIEHMADFLFGKYGQSQYQANYISFVANADSDLMVMALKGEPGDFVDIYETVTGIATEHIITGIDMNITEGMVIQCGWTVVPVEAYCDIYSADTDDTYWVDGSGNKYCGVYQ